MFDNFKEFNDWLLRFPTGKQIQKVLTKVTGEEVTGFLITDSDFYENPVDLNFHIVTNSLYINGVLVLDNKDKNNHKITFNTKLLSDIVSKEVSLKDQGEQLSPYFQTQVYTFVMRDGTSITFAANPKHKYRGNFEEFVSVLLSC